MSERTWFLTTLLRIQSVFSFLMGVSWITTSTTNRLAGVSWLEYAFAALPNIGVYEANADTVMGGGWILAAVVMAVAGWFGGRSKNLENLGFGVAIFWPLLAATIFLVAFFQGTAPVGWIGSLTYLSLIAPYAAHLRKYPGMEGVSLATGSIPIPGATGDDHGPGSGHDPF